MNVSVIERTPRRVTYLRRTGAYGEELSIFWQEDVYPWMVKHDLLGAPRYGISLDDPSITAPQQCRYDACVEIAADRKLPRDVLTATIPGGRYAVVQFEDTALAMAPVWDALLRDWLPGSGFQLDARPMFEYYGSDARFDPDTGVMQCQICIPVVPA